MDAGARLASEPKRVRLRRCGRAPSRGVTENKHSIDVEYSPPPPPYICMSIHPALTVGHCFPILGEVLVLNDPPARGCCSGCGPTAGRGMGSRLKTP